MFGRVDLLHRGDHRLDVDRREHEGVALGAQGFVDQGGLLRDVVGRGRDVVEHRHPVRLCHRLGARAHRAGDRVARALGEDGDGLGGGRQGAGRYQARNRGCEPSTMVFHPLLPVACGAGRSSSSPFLLIVVRRRFAAVSTISDGEPTYELPRPEASHHHRSGRALPPRPARPSPRPRQPCCAGSRRVPSSRGQARRRRPASARDCQMFPCSLKRFKIKFDLANCHSGPAWLELNNNKKKQRKHGKDATKLAPRATSPDNAWR